ncbi:MAG: acyltransferase [Candidatus Dormibacteraeota bacterium]|nr:acyltransferase [Candidatus Dormibacteraeota bacterium]
MSAAAVRERRHLFELDLVRVQAVALVVGAHTAAVINLTALTGGAVMIFHTSREAFFMLTAFVLMYGYARMQVHWPAFWRKRWLLVGVPYVVWSVIYFVVSGLQTHTVTASWSTLGTLASDLVLGKAGYQLYFLVVSMQLYLVFPLLRGLIVATRQHHLPLLAACAAYQVVFSIAVQLQWNLGFLTAWLRGPDAALLSYVFYIAAGAVAAWHADAFLAFTRRHAHAILGGAAAAVAVSLATYAVQLTAAGMSPNDASAVFQPVLVLESAAVAWALLAIGVLWTDRAMPRRRAVLALSVRSFGVYLVHPLLLTGVLSAATAVGLTSAVEGIPAVAQLALLLLVVAPVTYTLAVVATGLVRSTPLSLALTGRPRATRTRRADRARPTSIPTPQPTEVAA